MSQYRRTTDSSRLRWMLLVEVAILVTILATAATQMAIVEDLTFADEAQYMQRGVDFVKGAESYSYVYSFGTLFSRDPAAVYFIGRCLGVAFLVLGVWVAGRLLGSPIAAPLGALLLVGLGSPYVWPGVGTFAAGLTAAAVAIMLKRTDAGGFTIAAVLMWVVAASRPEYWPAATLCALFALYKVFKEGRTGGLRATALIVTNIAVPALFVTSGSIDFGGARTWLAFGQHYAYAHARNGEEPWLGWEPVVSRDFGGASTIFEAFTASPGALLSHMWGNVIRIPGEMWTSLTWGRNTIPGLAFSNIAALAILAALLALGIWLLVLTVRQRGTGRVIKQVLAPDVWPIHSIVILSIVPVVVLYPRFHYMQPWIAGLVLVGIFAMSRLRRRMKAAAVVASVLLVAVPVSVSMASGLNRLPYKRNLEVVRELRQIPTGQVVATSLSELDVYVPSVRAVAPGAEDGSFAHFLERESVSVIVIDAAFWEAGQSLPDFTSFNPEAVGFRLIQTEPKIFRRDSPD